MTKELINDPVKGIASANEHIRKLEEMIEEARASGDLASAIRAEGHLVKWEQILQYWIHQAYQQGKTKEDLTVSLSRKDEKKRFNAVKPKRKGAPGSEPARAVGAQPDSQDVGVEEPIRVATTGSGFSVAPDHTELLASVGQKLYSSNKDAPQGDNDPESPDSDNS